MSAANSFWQSPDGNRADDLDSFAPSGNPYAGIPDFDGADFSTHPDTPPDSVPVAMAPSMQHLPVTVPVGDPPKDNA